MAMATHRQTERYLKPLLRKLSRKVIIMGLIINNNKGKPFNSDI